MKMFDRWFLKQSKKAWESVRFSTSSSQSAKPIDDSILGPKSANISLRMHKANGGMVIEISSYDVNSDKHHRDLYVVPDGKKIGDELTSIIMQHSLRND